MKTQWRNFFFGKIWWNERCLRVIFFHHHKFGSSNRNESPKKKLKMNINIASNGLFFFGKFSGKSKKENVKCQTERGNENNWIVIIWGKTVLEYKIIGGGGQTHICDWHIHKTKQTTKYQLNIKREKFIYEMMTVTWSNCFFFFLAKALTSPNVQFRYRIQTKLNKNLNRNYIQIWLHHHHHRWESRIKNRE